MRVAYAVPFHLMYLVLTKKFIAKMKHIKIIYEFIC
jgi:hypothetical protein